MPALLTRINGAPTRSVMLVNKLSTLAWLVTSSSIPIANSAIALAPAAVVAVQPRHALGN